MKLTRYLSERGISQSDFGNLIARSQAAVARYANGNRRPDMATIEKIHIATGGKVTWSDWHPEMVKAMRRAEKSGAAA